VDRFRIDTIFHLAAETHVDNSIVNPNVFIETNVIGTLNLLNQVRDSGLRFVHVSTDEVYGSLTSWEDPFTEESQYNPSSPYSASKAGSDHLVKAYAKTYGMDNIVTHCSNNFGPNQHTEKLVPKTIDLIKKDLPVTIFGNGMNVRDWIFVEDHCEALIFLAQEGRSGETYNIGANNELHNLDMVSSIAYEMGNRVPKIERVPDRAGHDFRYAINSSKIKTLVWKPRTSFKDGLKRTIESYK
jgi:dTDP-glucose 4,6-dehydratase